MNNQFNITISYNSETKYKWKKGQYTTSFCTSGSHLKKIKSLLKKKPQAPPPLCGLIEKAISHLTEFNSKLLFYIIQICDKALIIIYVIYVNNICWRNNCFSMFKLTTVTPHVSVVSNTWITIQTLLMSSMWTSDVIQPEKNWACWEKRKVTSIQTQKHKFPETVRLDWLLPKKQTKKTTKTCLTRFLVRDSTLLPALLSTCVPCWSWRRLAGLCLPVGTHSSCGSPWQPPRSSSW